MKHAASNVNKPEHCYDDVLADGCAMEILPIEDATQSYFVYQCTQCDDHPENICEWCIINHHGNNCDQPSSEGRSVFIHDVQCDCAISSHRSKCQLLSRPTTRALARIVRKATESVEMRMEENEKKLDSESQTQMSCQRAIQCFTIGEPLGIIEEEQVSARMISLPEDTNPTPLIQKITDSIDDGMKHQVLSELKASKFRIPSEYASAESDLIPCPVLTYLGKKYAYRRVNHPEEIRCIYCIKNCTKARSLSSFQQIAENAPNAYCGCMSHSKMMIRSVFIKLLTEEKIFDVYIDKLQLPSKLINMPGTFEKTREYYKMLRLKNFSQIDRPYKQFNAHQDKENYNEKIYNLEQALICTFPVVFKTDYFALSVDDSRGDTFTSNFENFQDFFSLETLLKMFPLPDEEISDEKEDKCDDYIIDLKRQFLHYSRKMVLLPKLKHCILSEFGDNENISPLHRLLFRKRTDNVSGLNKENYLKLLAGIYAHITEYIEHKHTKVNVGKIIFEYLKYVNVFHYFSDTHEHLEEHVRDIYQIITLYESKYGEQDELVQGILDEVTLKLMMKINDKKVEQMIMKSSEESDVGFCFETDKVQKKMIKTLFTLPGPREIHTQTPYIKKQKIYDMLINQFDKYSETLKSILEAKDHQLFLQLLHHGEAPQGQVISDHIISLYNVIDKAKTLFYKGTITHSEFCECAIAGLISLRDSFSLSIQRLDTDKDYIGLFSAQICIAKYGLIDMLSRLYCIVNSEEFETLKAEKIQEAIKDIFKLLTLKNPFIAVIFFSKIQITTFFSNSVCENNKCTAEFYESLIKTLKKSRYRFDAKFSIQTLIAELKDFDIGNHSEEEEHYYMLLLNLVKKCLVLATDQSKESSHCIVAYRISRILQNPNFTTPLRDMPNKSPNVPPLRLIFLVFEILNSLSDYAFSQCNPNSFIADVENILYNCPELDFKERRIFNKFLARCCLENSFKNFQANTTIQLLDKEIWNLLDFFKTDSLLNETYSEIELDEKVETKSSGRKNVKLYGLRNILVTLTKYKSHVLQKDINKSKDIKSWRVFVKYFQDAIFNPVMDALYKLSYFAPVFPLKWKYLIFTVTHLFFKCFKIFLDYCQKMIHGNTDIALYLRHFILIDDISNINKNTGVIIGLLHAKIDQFAKMASFDIENILSSWEEIAKFWLPFSKTGKTYKDKYRYEYDVTQESNHPLYKPLKDCYEHYIDMKSDFDSNVLSTLLRKDDNDRELNADSEKGNQNKKQIDVKGFNYGIFAYDLFSQLNYFADEDKFPTLSPLPLKNYRAMQRIVRLFQVKPEMLQEIFTSNTEETRHLVFSIIRDQLAFFLPLIFFNFNKRDCRDLYAYENFVNALEFLRLLCENHNVFMQTYFLGVKEMNGTTAQTDFFTFLRGIPRYIINHLTHWINKKPIAKYFHKPGINLYFNDLIQCIFKFFIECIQGTLPANLDTLFTTEFKCEFLQTFDKTMLSIQYGNYIYRERDYYLLHAMRFVNALVDENNLSENHKRFIYDCICIRKLFNICQCYFKKMVYYKKTNCRIDTKQDTEGLELIEKNMNTQCQYEELLIDYGIIPNFENDIYCQIACELYSYIYRLAHENIQNEGESVNMNINVQDNIFDAKKYIFPEDQKDLKQDKFAYEMNKFFTTLFRKVELTWKESSYIPENVEKRYEKLFDTNIDPDEKAKHLAIPSLEVSIELKKKYCLQLGSDAEGCVNKIRLASMEIECSDEPFPVYFRIHPDGIFIEADTIKRFKMRSIMDGGVGRDDMLSFLTDKDEGLQSAIDVRKRLEEEKYSLFKSLLSLKMVYHTKVSLYLCLIVNILMHYSVYATEMSQSNLIYYISLANFIYLSLLLFIYVSMQTYSRKVFSFSYFTVDPAMPISWSFVTCGLGLFTPFFFFYSVQLFAAFSVVKTMNAVLQAIKLRFEQFLSAAYVIIVLVLFFSLIAFVFFKNEFYNPDSLENKCDSLFHCFFFALNTGLRSQSVGLPMYSFQNDNAKYWIEFFFDMIFYMCLIFIMLNVINGIIVDTFQELREEDNRRETLKENICFVCQLVRTQFEVKGKDFEDHKRNEHNLRSYFQYLLKVQKSNVYDLNALDTHVLECIKAKKTDIFPYEKTCSLK